MPLINSTYETEWYMTNTHVQTVYASQFRQVPDFEYRREKVELPDGDFIDIDWLEKYPSNSDLVIVCHGLGGNSHGVHVRGLVKTFYDAGFDVCATNFRGASGEVNRTFKGYHCGVSDDLDAVIQQVISKKQYAKIHLCAYSLGGNVVLKYLGEKGDAVPKEVVNAAVMSVPCELKGSAEVISRWYNRQYVIFFMLSLKKMIDEKLTFFSKEKWAKPISIFSSLTDFDNAYTAPAHGFLDAQDYYRKVSGVNFLHNIKIPTLLLQAKDDTFISEGSRPYTIAEKHPHVYLEVTENGGHAGFVRFADDGMSYAEKRIRDFILSVL